MHARFAYIGVECEYAGLDSHDVRMRDLQDVLYIFHETCFD